MAPLQAAAAQQYTLQKGESLQPASHTLLWCTLRHGRLAWLGCVALPLIAAPGLLPLGPGMWVVALDAAELETVPTDAIDEVDTLLAGVERLQRLLLSYEALTAQQRADAERHGCTRAESTTGRCGRPP